MARAESKRKKQKTSWRARAEEKRAAGKVALMEIEDLKKELKRVQERMIKERQEQLKRLGNLLSKEDIGVLKTKMKEMQALGVKVPGVPKNVVDGVGALILAREMLKKNIDLLTQRMSRTNERRAETMLELEKSIGELKAVNSLLNEYNKITVGDTPLVDAVFRQIEENRLKLEMKRAEELERRHRRMGR